jgi:polysaccharide export outer membrane protein
MRKVLLVSLVLSIIYPAGAAAEQQKALPKELLQYVGEAVKLGLKDSEIQQNAISAGWPAGVVAQTLAQIRSTSGSGAAPVSASSKLPVKEQPSPGPAQPDAAGTPAGTASQPGKDRTTTTPAASSPDRPETDAIANDYLIGEGDELQIAVWKEPDASVPNAVVRPDGKIAMPLLKEMHVVGLTPTQAEKMITERLTKFIPAADVTVVVTGIHSKKIYVVGAVKKEGPIPYTYRMTIMQALSEAGGLTDYAKRKKIYVLRTENGKEFRLPFDYDAALKGERMELNIPLLPNDTLVIPN